MIKKGDLQRKLEDGQQVRITDINGLSLLIRGGKKGTTYTFVHRVVVDGKRIDKRIRAETLEEARKIALDRFTNAKSGLHPEGISECRINLAQLLTDYQDLQIQKKISANTEKKMRLYISKYLMPHGDIPVHKIKARLVYDVILKPLIDRELWDSVGYIKRIMQKSMKLGRVRYPEWNLDPLSEIDLLIQRPNGVSQHLPAMTDGDISINLRRLYEVFRYASQMSTRCLCELSVHLLLRPSELSEIMVTDVDMQNLILTVPKTKTIRDGSGFRVPLSEQVVKLLKIAISTKHYEHNPYLFESRVQLGGHVSHETVNNMLKRHGFKGVQTAHGFRAIGRTWMESQNIKFEVAEMCLSHRTGNNTVNAYRRTDYLDERRQVMQQWSDFISHSVNGFSLV